MGSLGFQVASQVFMDARAFCCTGANSGVVCSCRKKVNICGCFHSKRWKLSTILPVLVQGLCLLVGRRDHCLVYRRWPAPIIIRKPPVWASDITTTFVRSDTRVRQVTRSDDPIT